MRYPKKIQYSLTDNLKSSDASASKKRSIGLCFCSKVKETIKRVKKEGLKKERNEVKERKR